MRAKRSNLQAKWIAALPEFIPSRVEGVARNDTYIPMTVFVFGNPELPEDSLPIRLLPKLREQFPDIDFQIKDPNEDWDIPEEMTILDTVTGIDRVTVFSDLDRFMNAPRISMHDFDLGSYLKYLKRLGKLKKIKIIGVPPTISESHALGELSDIIRLF